MAAPLIWVFGEIVPKSVFQQRADAVTPVAIFVLKAASYLFSPILVVFSFLTRVVTRVFGSTAESPFTLREQIITMLGMPAESGDIQPVESNMIRRLFDFSETTIQEIMVPLIDVVAIEKAITRREAISIAVEQNHVRLPVYEDRVDRIVGVLCVLDLLGLSPDEAIEEHMRPVRYVPGSKSSRDLLLEFRRDRDVMAVVVDEFGGAMGIVSIEDIMEEVVEDIEDEFDAGEKPAQWIRKISHAEYLVSGRTELETLERELGIDLPQTKYVTVAGLLLGRTREVPTPGAVVELANLVLVVERATPQAIQEVRIRLS